MSTENIDLFYNLKNRGFMWPVVKYPMMYERVKRRGIWIKRTALFLPIFTFKKEAGKGQQFRNLKKPAINFLKS